MQDDANGYELIGRIDNDLSGCGGIYSLDMRSTLKQSIAKLNYFLFTCDTRYDSYEIRPTDADGATGYPVLIVNLNGIEGE